jgi:predicted nucleic acid-binding protein
LGIETEKGVKKVSRIVVCDTGPLIHLSEADALFLLKFAGEILIPPAVVDEFKRNLPKGKLPDWIQIHTLHTESNSQVMIWIENYDIDRGEAEAIGLAIQQNSNWLLTDDAKARQFAEGLGLEVHGSIGLLLWAIAVRHVESRERAYRLLNSLKRSSLWISEHVLMEAMKAIDQLTLE